MIEVGSRVGLTYANVHSLFLKYGIRPRSKSEGVKLAIAKRKWHWPKGEKHPRWKGGRILTRDGYVLINGVSHHRVRKHGYVLEHILVWEQVHGKPLPEGWLIHHLNGIKSDNRPQNLVAMPKKKHYIVLVEKAKRIRELEAENTLLRRALEDSQMIFVIGEN